MTRINPKFNPNYTVAIIKTADEKFNTRINYYDDNLNLINIQKLNLCNLGKGLVGLNEKKYMLSKGNDLHIGKDVIEIDSQTGQLKKYNVDQGYNLSMTVNDKYVFACNADLEKSTISRCDKITGSIKKLYIPDIIIKSMHIYEDNILYAFGGNSHDQTSNLYLIDTEALEIIRSFNIKDKGYYQKQCIKINDDLYFISYISFGKEGNNIQSLPENKLTKFNTKTYEFSDIEVDKCPNQLVRFGDNLYITYSNDNPDYKKVTVYNFKTGEQVQKELENDNNYIAIDGNNKRLYSIDDKKLYQYDLDNFKLIKTVQFQDSNDDYFVWSMFLK